MQKAAHLAFKRGVSNYRAHAFSQLLNRHGRCYDAGFPEQLFGPSARQRVPWSHRGQSSPLAAAQDCLSPGSFAGREFRQSLLYLGGRGHFRIRRDQVGRRNAEDLGELDQHVECYRLATLLDVRDGCPAESDRRCQARLGELLPSPRLRDALTNNAVERVLGGIHAPNGNANSPPCQGRQTCLLYSHSLMIFLLTRRRSSDYALRSGQPGPIADRPETGRGRRVVRGIPERTGHGFLPNAGRVARSVV